MIDRIRKASGAGPSRPGLRLGIGDDCAILSPPGGSEVVVTTDFSLEGRHFRTDRHPARSVGHRVLARGLSDLAAMGAAPLAAFLSLALPSGYPVRWLDGFLAGFFDLASRTGTPLAGGDTSESPSAHILADITLLGTVPTGKALRRSGAHPGDLIYVTGSLGGAAAELERVLQRPGISRLGKGPHPHLLPEPRLAIGQKLLSRATAAMDLSDGLSTDLTHLCRASGVSAAIDAAALPIAKSATAQQALHGGEDYELLFTASPATRLPKSLGGVSITAVGQVQRKQRHVITLVDHGTRTPLAPGGWEHLR